MTKITVTVGPYSTITATKPSGEIRCAIGAGTAEFDRSILHYLYKQYGITIQADMAAAIRRQIGSAYPCTPEKGMLIRGQTKDGEKTVLLTSEEIRDVLRVPVFDLVRAVQALCDAERTLVVDGEPLAGFVTLLSEELQ